jgi:hypothetical protein
MKIFRSRLCKCLYLFGYNNLLEGTNFNFEKYQKQKYAGMNEAAEN